MNRISGPSGFPQFLCGYGKATCRLYRDRLEFFLLSKAGYREGDEERCD